MTTGPPAPLQSVKGDDGKTYVDDQDNIANADLLLRRIPPDWIVWDGNTGTWRPSSAAFQNHPSGSPMSVRVRPRLESIGLQVASVLADYPDFGLVEFETSKAREKKQVVALEEVAEEPAHGIVAGKKTGGVRNHLVKHSAWSMPLSEAALAKAELKRGAT